MAGSGAIFKRCGCRDTETKKRLERACPRLRERGHGTWSFHCTVTTMFGGRERVRRGGHATRQDATTARDDLLERSRAERTTATWTTGRWLRHWLAARASIRPSTLRSYTEHVERHLIPHVGNIRLGELTGRHVAAMFTKLASTDTRHGRPPTPATLHRIRATLRSALNAAIRDGLLRDNPARFIELPTPRRPQPQVWTNHRVDAWQRDGPRPSVAVWTAKQLATFLESIAEDHMFAMWWLIALRGIRRGEAAGLRWADVDLDQRVIVIDQQRIAYGRTVTVGPPNTRASRRTIALDRTTVRLLRANLHRQRAERDAAGQAWHESGYVFTTDDGTPLHPDWITRRFRRLVELSGLPPVRLHNLRHAAAILAHAASADLKTVQEQLGHTSIVLTADTYTSVLLELHFKTAEATARLVLPKPPPATPDGDTNPRSTQRSPQHRTIQRDRNPYAPSDPARTAALARAAHS